MTNVIDFNRRSARTRRLRPSRWLMSLGAIATLVGIIALTPLQGTVLQAILLGPGSLFPPSLPRATIVIRNGHRLSVPVRRGTVEEGLSFASAALTGRLESYDLYIPPGYSSPENSARRYPVLYLLHGAPGQPGDWIHGMHVQLLEDEGIAAGALPPMIMVMPEGNGGIWRDSQYVNTNGGFKAEQLVTHDVVNYIDTHYRTIAGRGARAIAGISEGGFGAMNLGLKHFNIFGTIVSISGYFSANPAEVFVGNDPWGHNWALMKANSPMDYVSRLTGMHDANILIMDNTDDGPYTQAAVRFTHLLARSRISFTLVLTPAPNLLAAHYWPYWHNAFPRALTYIGQHLSR